MKKVLLVIGFILSAAVAIADTQTWGWSAPTTGNPAVSYIVEQRVDDVILETHTTVVSTSFTWVDYPFNSEISVRVRAQEAQGRQGPYSLWSEVFVDAGPPGPPGQPVRNTTLIPVLKVLSIDK